MFRVAISRCKGAAPCLRPALQSQIPTSKRFSLQVSRSCADGGGSDAFEAAPSAHVTPRVSPNSVVLTPLFAEFRRQPRCFGDISSEPSPRHKHRQRRYLEPSSSAALQLRRLCLPLDMQAAGGGPHHQATLNTSEESAIVSTSAWGSLDMASSDLHYRTLQYQEAQHLVALGYYLSRNRKRLKAEGCRGKDGSLPRLNTLYIHLLLQLLTLLKKHNKLATANSTLLPQQVVQILKSLARCRALWSFQDRSCASPAEEETTASSGVCTAHLLENSPVPNILKQDVSSCAPFPAAFYQILISDSSSLDVHAGERQIQVYIQQNEVSVASRETPTHSLKPVGSTRNAKEKQDANIASATVLLAAASLARELSCIFAKDLQVFLEGPPPATSLRDRGPLFFGPEELPRVALHCEVLFRNRSVSEFQDEIKDAFALQEAHRILRKRVELLQDLTAQLIIRMQSKYNAKGAALAATALAYAERPPPACLLAAFAAGLRKNHRKQIYSLVPDHLTNIVFFLSRRKLYDCELMQRISIVVALKADGLTLRNCLAVLFGFGKLGCIHLVASPVLSRMQIFTVRDIQDLHHASVTRGIGSLLRCNKRDILKPLRLLLLRCPELYGGALQKRAVYTGLLSRRLQLLVACVCTSAACRRPIRRLLREPE